MMVSTVALIRALPEVVSQSSVFGIQNQLDFKECHHNPTCPNSSSDLDICEPSTATRAE